MGHTRRKMLELSGTMADGVPRTGRASGLQAAAAVNRGNEERRADMRNESPDAYAFGAKGDGETDDSAALQKAIDAAAKKQGTVWLRPGVYRVADVQMRPHTALVCDPTWSYRDPGGTVLKLRDGGGRCVLNITSSYGCTLSGLSIIGDTKRVERQSGEVHGIMLDKDNYGNAKEEDSLRIERCRVCGFTGDAVHLNRAWCFIVRHCFLRSSRNGINFRGFDGFILDNWLSANRQAGFGAYKENCAVTMTANRIEWNGEWGIHLAAGHNYTIVGNTIDRCGGAGMAIVGRDGTPSRWITASGNFVFRSGDPKRGHKENCHVLLRDVEGLVFSGNTLCAGRGDMGGGAWGPDTGMILARLRGSVVSGNSLHIGALKELIRDEGGHEDCTIGSNAGSVPAKQFVEAARDNNEAHLVGIGRTD